MTRAHVWIARYSTVVGFCSRREWSFTSPLTFHIIPSLLKIANNKLIFWPFIKVIQLQRSFTVTEIYTFFRSILETVHVVWKQCSQFRQYGIVHPYSKVSQVIRISEDVFENSAFNFGDSAHRIRRMKVSFRRSAALRQTFQIRHNAKRIRQCSCNFDNKFWALSE